MEGNLEGLVTCCLSLTSLSHLSLSRSLSRSLALSLSLFATQALADGSMEGPEAPEAPDTAQSSDEHFKLTLPALS